MSNSISLIISSLRNANFSQTLLTSPPPWPSSNSLIDPEEAQKNAEVSTASGKALLMTHTRHNVITLETKEVIARCMVSEAESVGRKISSPNYVLKSQCELLAHEVYLGR